VHTISEAFIDGIYKVSYGIWVRVGVALANKTTLRLTQLTRA
jgi:hypothetical protein